MANSPCAAAADPVCNVTEYPNYCHYNPFGPGANCTLDVCCPEYSVYGYIPVPINNVAFMCAYALAIGVHVTTGVIWKQWWFMWCMVVGCLDEFLGYAGRAWMSRELWSFNTFMIQVGELMNPSYFPIYYESLETS